MSRLCSWHGTCPRQWADSVGESQCSVMYRPPTAIGGGGQGYTVTYKWLVLITELDHVGGGVKWVWHTLNMVTDENLVSSITLLTCTLTWHRLILSAQQIAARLAQQRGSADEGLTVVGSCRRDHCRRYHCPSWTGNTAQMQPQQPLCRPSFLDDSKRCAIHGLIRVITTLRYLWNQGHKLMWFHFRPVLLLLLLPIMQRMHQFEVPPVSPHL